MIHEIFHSLLRSWFQLVEQWGYWGVFFLMALESSIVPVPSEIVMPPAAFWAAQGRMTFWGVVLAGTGGSYFGSLVSYYIARWAGAPFVHRFGKYFLFTSEKIELAEQWLKKYGVAGIFFARLLPVVRHLISIPAGVFRMDFKRFSVATIIGAFLWCTVLSWFGGQVIGQSPEILTSPESLISIIRQKLQWFVVAAIVFCLLYALVVRFKRRMVHSKV